MYKIFEVAAKEALKLLTSPKTISNPTTLKESTEKVITVAEKFLNSAK